MSTKSVLLTGARAPVTLEAARAFKKAGYRVIVFDVIGPTMTQFSAAVDEHIVAPLEQLNEIAKGVDLVIPMCEEVVAISKMELPCEVFTSSFEVVHALHNKWTFLSLVEGVKVPKSVLLKSDSDPFLKGKVVIKPVYSRFSASVQIVNSRPPLEYCAKNPLIAQQFIEGKKVCTYAIVKGGKVMAYSEYEVTQTMGFGAGIGLLTRHTEALKAFVEKMALKLNFTGQLAFDLIEDMDGVIGEVVA